MSEVKERKTFEDRIKSTLKNGLAKGGIGAKITTERVPLTKLRRVSVTAKEFRKMNPSERQDLVWRILGQKLSFDEQLLISMVITLTPDEIKGKW